MTTVWEDPTDLNYETVYTYDALNDLATVVQGGSHNRTFAYDSLNRLTSSTNPESGTVTYTYDADSNVLGKKDARSITITYAYDALNRMTGKTYSNGDSPVTYTYDQLSLGGGCYNMGRRTMMTDAGGSDGLLCYDPMGRELQETRTTNSVAKKTFYTYNLDGSLATLTDPSGRIITYAYSAAARPLSAIDTANSINYATSALYSPAGVSSLTNGASLISTFYYNTRFQPCRISVKSSGTAPGSCTDASNIGNVLDYTFNFSLGTANNGNVMGVTNNVDTTRSQSFTYDHLNRILTAETASTFATSPAHCWGEAYVYDNATTGEFGNLTNINAVSSAYTGCTQEILSVTALANNQLSATGFSYDASGNVLTDGSNTYTWNAEGEIKSAAGVNYTYDGDGRRVEKSSGTLSWYGTLGDPLTETDLSGNLTYEYIFFGGKRIARRDSSGNAVYYVADHLGTSRVVTNSTGSILDQSDFYPFGGERVLTASSGNTYKFTGKQRDSESGLDNFGARYNRSSIGRFMSPDPLAGHTQDPQTLNRYVYVRDNPLSLTDPTGLDFNLQCGQQSNTCQKDSNGNLVQGTTTTTKDANGNTISTFTPTVVTSASLKDPNSGNTATVDQNGVQITTKNGTSQGVFITDTPAANDIQGTGALQGFSFNINGNCSQTCLSSGEWNYNGSVDVRTLLMQRGAFDIPFEDEVAAFGKGAHPYSTQYRFGGADCNKLVSCSNSPHLSVTNALLPIDNVPATGEFHVDAHGDWYHHFEDVNQ